MTGLMSSIREHRIPGITLSDGAIHPQYDGQSILNIPSSVCHLLDIPPFAAPPLKPEILAPLGSGYRNVVVILVDALAFHRLERWMAMDGGRVWGHLAENGVLAPLTSVVPSTTSAAITTLWTASPPARHGVMGYEMWLREYGVVANMIQHKPMSFMGGTGILREAGFRPETFLPTPSISHHLRAHSITPHVFQHYGIIHSGMSQTFFGDAERHTISTPPDLWIAVRELVNDPPAGRNYIWVYWSVVDGLSHLHGPDSEQPEAEFLAFSAAFERYFLDKLSPAARGDTLLILTADHGQIATDKRNTNNALSNHPDFMRMLHMKPNGENRLAYLFVRPGQMEAVCDTIRATWPDQFDLLDPAAAVQAGLFGPGPPYERIAARTGDLIAAARGDGFWWWEESPDPLAGRHGGLSAQEMIVPFLAAKP
jgi:predicted AlkP superfamily pyrophosphatase or phosphodiesterase